jgi:alpha-amylase
MKIKSLAACVVMLLTCGASGEAAHVDAPGGNVFVHLFHWSWTEVKNECQKLKDIGYTAIQVSPAQETKERDNPSDEWWKRYQPVSFRIGNRGGSEAEFDEMVRFCQEDVGIGIYVDAVINHLLSRGTPDGAGFLGTEYRGFASDPLQPEIVGLFGPQDFHTDFDRQNIDYGNKDMIWKGQLGEAPTGLVDLATETDWVREQIANYLITLLNPKPGVRPGVAGIRIDGAKHMDHNDIRRILEKVDAQVSRDYYLFKEVIGRGAGQEAVDDPVYLPPNIPQGTNVTEFEFSKQITRVFRKQGSLSELVGSFPINNWNNMGPGDKSVIFVDNHDEQRGNKALTWLENKNSYVLANAFMLGWDYAHPKVMSSFVDSGGGYGNERVSGAVANNCNVQEFLCEHLYPPIANMVKFRRVVGTAPVVNKAAHGPDRISFSRGNRGFIYINQSDQTINTTVQTNMPAGSYCNIWWTFDVTAADNPCTDSTITVDNSGNASFTVPANKFVAIHAESKISSRAPDNNVQVHFTCNKGFTFMGQSVYVVGSISQLGSWDPSGAVKLAPTIYPAWTGTVSIPPGDVEWKCLKRNETAATHDIEWQGGTNNSFTASGTSMSVAASF